MKLVAGEQLDERRREVEREIEMDRGGRVMCGEGAAGKR
jgi:hypothetical protein